MARIELADDLRMEPGKGLHILTGGVLEEPGIPSCGHVLIGGVEAVGVEDDGGPGRPDAVERDSVFPDIFIQEACLLITDLSSLETVPDLMRARQIVHPLSFGRYGIQEDHHLDLLPIAVMVPLEGPGPFPSSFK